MHVNVIEVFFQSIDESVNMSSEIFQTLGMNGLTDTQLAQLKRCSN